MDYPKDSLLNPNSTRIIRSYKVLQSLKRLNRGYLASPNPGRPDGTGRYNIFWLRDIMYATYANEYIGNMKEMIQSYELVMTIMMKYKNKICDAIRKMPRTGSALHARYHPNTLEELSPDWGHHQLDVLGLFLYKTGDLIKKGHEVIKTRDERELIMEIIQYLFTYRWETHPDYGMWEEGPELHSSSLGAVLAGLTMWFDDGYYDYKYPHKIDLFKIVAVSERYFDTGRDELYKLLPHESKSRDCDFAQLSLIWPYNIVDEDMKKQITDNVEKSLVRGHGVIRYKGDRYFNSDPGNTAGNEAQWPLGLAWLAIVHNKQAQWRSDDLSHALGHLKKSKSYILQMDGLMIKGAIPEIYSAGRPNENTPLSWAHSFHIIALQSFLNSVEALRKKHNIEISDELEVLK